MRHFCQENSAGLREAADRTRDLFDTYSSIVDSELSHSSEPPNVAVGEISMS